MKRIVGLAFVATAGMAVLSLPACGRAGGAEVREAVASSPGDAPIRLVNVETVVLEPRPFTNFVRIVGTVEAERDVVVTAQEGGTVEALVAKKGARMAAGQALLRIDDDVLRAQLEQAVSQAALAEETWTRQRQLWERDSVGTEMAYLQAKYNARTARAQAQVLSERVDRAVVRAPFAGILDDRMVEVGSTVPAGAPVARVLDVDTVKIAGGVPERFASDVARGTPVTVTVDALGGREYAGTIDFVGSAVDGGDRTFKVEVHVPNPGLGIKPGMVANVSIARRALDSVLVVARPAVLRREAGYVVFVARPDGNGGWRAEARPVVPGPSGEQEVVITGGLSAGERVVVVGQQRLADGNALRLGEPGTVRAAATETSAPAPADPAAGESTAGGTPGGEG